MVEIPKQLQNKELNFVLLGQWDTWARYGTIGGKSKIVEKRVFKPEEFDKIDKDIWKPLGKAPYEKDWQHKKYTYDNPKLINHSKNFGVIGGYGRLRILDIDDPQLAESIKIKIGKTYTVKTGSGGMHFYLYSDYYVNHVLNNEKGELRADNYQVVSAPCRHPTGNYYTIIDDSPIREIEVSELKDILDPYLRDSVNDETREFKRDETKSGEEMSFLCKLILKGYSKEQCFEKMKLFQRWVSSPEQYRVHTYDKAINFVFGVIKKRNEDKKTNPEDSEKLELESWNESFYYDSDLKEYKRPDEEYFIEGLIPKGQIGVLVGNTQERKTYTMLYLAFCAASGKPAFGFMKIPKKIKVFIIDEENGKPELDRRILELKKGLGISGQYFEVAILSFFNAKLDNESKQRRILKFIEEFKPDLIFVDCLQRVVSFNIDKDNDRISEFMTGFVRPITNKYGCSWIFLHHYRKKDNKAKFTNPLDEIRGGSELRNYCRVIVGVQRAGKQSDPRYDMIILKRLKMSNAPVFQDIVISFESRDNSLFVNYEGEAEDVFNSIQLAAQEIKKWIVEQSITGEFKTKDVEEAEPGGYKRTTISSALKVLQSDGFLEKVKRGVWKVKAVKENKNICSICKSPNAPIIINDKIYCVDCSKKVNQ